MSNNSFVKQPAEKRTIAIEYQDELATGVTLSGGTVAAVNLSDGSSASATVLVSTTATISGTQARAQVQAGTNGTDYKITFLTTLSNSDIWEDDVTMKVKES